MKYSLGTEILLEVDYRKQMTICSLTAAFETLGINRILA